MVGHSAKAYCKGIQPELISVASIAKWSKAPVCGTGDHGFESRCSPQTRRPKHNAPVAQRIEYWASDPGVVGSNPARRAILDKTKASKIFLGASFLFFVNNRVSHICFYSSDESSVSIDCRA